MDDLDQPPVANGTVENPPQDRIDPVGSRPLDTGGVIAPRRNKGGRPLGSKNKTRSDDAPEKETPKRKAESPSADPAFFVETVVSVYELADGTLCNVILSKVRRYVTAKEDQPRVAEVEALVKANRLTDKDKEVLKRNLIALANKYPILAFVGPEVALLVFTGQYLMRMRQLSNLVETLKPAPKNAN